MHLNRLVTVLETVALAGRPITAADLHEMSGIPTPTCYRLLQTLFKEGLLECEGSKAKYIIGSRLVRIAQLSRTDEGIRGSVSPALKEAANQHGEAVFLSRLRKDGVGIIHVETPSQENRSFIHPGLGLRPLHACSCSKVIAAFAGDGLQENIFKRPMKAYTKNTQTTREELENEFKKIREQGFAECVEEIELGVASVAAPVDVNDAGAVFSVGMTGPIHRFNSTHRAHIGDELIDLAKRVETLVQFTKSI